MSDPTKKYTRDYAEQLRKYSASDDGFAGAIAANPTDPAPHLVYADWLMDRGREDEEMDQRLHALSKSPDDEGLRDHVADHLEQRGRGYEAHIARHHKGRGVKGSPVYLRVDGGQLKADVRVPNDETGRGYSPDGWWNGVGYGGGYVDPDGRITTYDPHEMFGDLYIEPPEDADYDLHRTFRDKLYREIHEASAGRWNELLQNPEFRDRHWRPATRSWE
jgi:uncharacterized protein (TIGR02996 family)